MKNRRKHVGMDVTYIIHGKRKQERGLTETRAFDRWTELQKMDGVTAVKVLLDGQTVVASGI